jgi:hypothetical protein
MSDPAQIPDEVVEAAAKAMPTEFDMEDYPDYSRQVIRAAIAAALNAWPNAEVVEWYHEDYTLILPLKEARDE